MVKEYTGKVDTMLSEKKESLKAKEAAAKDVAHQEASRNAYATLMPLALPAPPLHGQQGGQQQGFGAFQGYQ